MNSREWMRRLSTGQVIVAVIVFLVGDAGDQLAHSSIIAEGAFDATAHLMTTLLVLWAVGGMIYEQLLVPALVISVAIDLDHVPQYLGTDFLTAGTPRPYTHALTSVVIVLLVAVLWRRRRTGAIAVAVGLVIHFWRDLAEPGSGVALLWPFTDHSFSLSHASYLAVMGLVIVVALCRAVRWPKPLIPALARKRNNAATTGSAAPAGTTTASSAPV
jgi:hypothetical protein